MEQFTIYSDLHLGAPDEIKENLEFNKNSIFLGDNFDFENTPKTDLEKFLKLRKEAMEKAAESGSIFIDGNHELVELKEDNFYAVKEETIFLHGDVFNYGFEGAKKWRTKRKGGRSKFYVMLYKLFRKICPNNINTYTFLFFGKKVLKRAAEFAKEKKCKRIVFGHFHLKKMFETIQDGIKILCVPRGKSVVTF